MTKREEKSKPNAAWAFCRSVLSSVSRTFALTIPVLPSSLADTVTCAYLLCRIADTIEDDGRLDSVNKTKLFDLLERLVQRPDDLEALEQFVVAWPHGGDADYDRLMQGSQQVIEAFATLPEHQKEPVKRCAHEMIAGMRVMTGTPSGEGVRFVSSSIGDLEQYCHYVAGTVGQMLTRLFGAHVGGWFASEERVEQGRRFGLGLQLTNILKDFVEDRRAGISFLPQPWLRMEGGEAEIHPRHKRELVERTLAHLDVAHRYTLALPREEEGIRLFCVWALWMAVTTLREICAASAESPKIDRNEVEEIVTYSRQVIGDDEALDLRYQEYRRQAATAAEGLAP